MKIKKFQITSASALDLEPNIEALSVSFAVRIMILLSFFSVSCSEIYGA